MRDDLTTRSPIIMDQKNETFRGSYKGQKAVEFRLSSLRFRRVHAPTETSLICTPEFKRNATKRQCICYPDTIP